LLFDNPNSRPPRDLLTTGRFAVVASEKRSNAVTGDVFVTGQLRNRDRLIRFIAGKGLQRADGNPMSPAELTATFEEGKVVDIAGKLGEFRGEIQIEIRTASAVALTAIDPEEFIPRSRFSTEALRADYDLLVGPLRQPWAGVVTEVVEPRFRQFATWPAARSIHHAWIGGLLEHTLEVARIALDVAAPVWDGVTAYELAQVFGNRIRRWQSVDLDLLVTAALLHDIGKLEEFSVGVSTTYSDAGQSLGHIHLGLFTIRDACIKLNLDAFDTGRLLHCIASHHGVPEFGSAIRPATAEALILSTADELSARLGIVSEAVEAELKGTAGWTERIPALDRRIWLQAARAAVALSDVAQSNHEE
jgi:3'-5' exoribonuclease